MGVWLQSLWCRLLVEKRQDAGRPPFALRTFSGGDDDTTASRQLGQAGQILDDDLAGAQPHLVQLEVHAVDRIRGWPVEAHAGDSAADQGHVAAASG